MPLRTPVHLHAELGLGSHGVQRLDSVELRVQQPSILNKLLTMLQTETKSCGQQLTLGGTTPKSTELNST